MVARAEQPTPYDHVPKRMADNLAFRRMLIERARKDREFQQELWIACKRDILFWINCFCWIFSPRDRKVLPFITYDQYQDDAIHEIKDAIEDGHDLTIEKSREVGASWMVLTVEDWFWQFHDMSTFLNLSRKEELVDARGNPDCLFWKTRHLIDTQPGWMQPSQDRRMMHVENMDRGGTIDGESTNKYAGVAGRRLAMLLDEFSKMENQDMIFTGTRDVTSCRIFLFTPEGSANKAYKIANTMPTMRKLSLHWSKHPKKGMGLYSVDDNGEIELIDKVYWTPKRVRNYRFVRQKPLNPKYRYRSPWYDAECERADNPIEIAKELDIDYQHSAPNFFDQVMLDELQQEHVRKPIFVGKLDYDLESCEPIAFVEDKNGPLRLWHYLDHRGKPPSDRRYKMGCDISDGTGASNSVASIGDCKTGEKVAELCLDDLRPHDFARYCVALAKFYRGSEQHWPGCQMNWESNGGVGKNFTLELSDIGYWHIHWRESEQTGKRQKGKIPGFWSGARSRTNLLLEYEKALRDRSFINPCYEEIVQECPLYVKTNTGDTVHISLTYKDSEFHDHIENHGDRVISSALLNMLMSREPIARPEEKPKMVVGSMEWMVEEEKRGRRGMLMAYGV